MTESIFDFLTVTNINIEQSAKTGLMIRESLAVGSKFFGVFVNAKLGVTAEYRPTTSGWATASTMVNIAQPFIWFKITKRMNIFTAFRSVDGLVWSVVGPPQTIIMDASNLKVGLALTSSYTFKMTEASYEDFENVNYFYPSASPTQSFAPSQAIPSLDIGNFNTNYKSEIDVQASKYIIKTSGGGISGSQDSFTFVNYEVEGDFDMTAKISSSNVTTSWAKAGLMARESIDSKSKMIFSLFAPQQGTIATLRSQYGGSTMNFQPFYDSRKWIWLRLKREGTSFSAFRSLTGNSLQECSWQPIRQFNSADIALNSTLQIGMAVTSSDQQKYATVTFEKFAIQKPSIGGTRGLRGLGNSS
jgi:regulation of enolase protein 1 (concanavalin A-like superfamily)